MARAPGIGDPYDSLSVLVAGQTGQAYQHVRTVAINIDAILLVAQNYEDLIAASDNITAIVNDAVATVTAEFTTTFVAYRDEAAASAATAVAAAADAAGAIAAGNLAVTNAALTAADVISCAAHVAACAASQAAAATSAGTATTKAAEAAASAAAAAASAADASAIVGGDFIPTSQKGAVNGVASLGAGGKVPSAQLDIAQADVAGLVAALAGKAPTAHTHAQADVTGLVAALAALTADVAARIQSTEKGVANGVTPLGVDGKVSVSFLPATVLGAAIYQSVWNAATNSPAIPAAAAGNKGFYYKVGTPGATAIDGISEWATGDWIISNGVTWDKIDNTDNIVSVAGLNGIISAAALKTALTLVKADIGLGNVDNTSDVNKPVSTAQQTALDAKADKLMPIVAKTVNYTLVQGDNNTAVTMNGVTLALSLANLAAGTTIVVRNIHATSPVTIALNGCTLLKNGSLVSAAGSLASGGVITLVNWGGSVWTASGSNLT